jgi:hypothetical protein
MPKRLTRKDAILEVYRRHGGSMSVRHLAQLCWDEGVWDESARRHMAFAAAKREVQTALQAKDGQGLPLAGPSMRLEGRARVWVQLELWDRETAVYNLGMRLRGIDKDYATAIAIHEYIDKRWGNAPPIPEWSFPDEAPCWWVEEPPDDPPPYDDDDD